MSKMKQSVWAIIAGAYFMAAPAFGEEFKCVVTDDMKAQHIVLVDTQDEQIGPKEMAYEATVTNKLGRDSVVTKVIECKSETESFSSGSARKMDQQMPR